MHKRAAGALVLALASGAGGGCSSTTRAHGGGPTSSALAREREPQGFETRIEAQLQQIKRRVWHDVGSGQLTADSIDAFEQRERQIEQQVSAARSDGAIDDFERRQIGQAVDSLSTVTSPPRYDAGPGGHGPGRPRPNWERYW